MAYYLWTNCIADHIAVVKEAVADTLRDAKKWNVLQLADIARLGPGKGFSIAVKQVC